MAQWADQGIIASISPDEIRTFMPNLAKAIDSVDKEHGQLASTKIKTGNPKSMARRQRWIYAGYNEAWLKAVGYSEPPKTLEELQDVLTNRQ